MSTPDFTTQTAGPEHIETLMPLVAGYHAFEALETTDTVRRSALAPLLEDPALGFVDLVLVDGTPVGYLAICYGYSIELGGRDAFVDEFFLIEAVRGRGLGRRILETLPEVCRAHGIRALHLEVARDNVRARNLYASLGFEPREKYHLMTLPGPT